MKPLDALILQLRLEGLEVFSGNLLRQVEIVPGEELPLMILANLAGNQLMLFLNASLSPALKERLADQAQQVLFPEIDPLLGVLHAHGISFALGHYKTSLFAATMDGMIQSEACCRSRKDPQVQEFGFGDFAEQVFVIEVNGGIASACVSTREDARCGEAWVYTDPQYRGHGFARKVVSAWAQSLLAAAKVPFYSHKISNIASANLARRLGLEPVFEEIVISYA